MFLDDLIDHLNTIEFAPTPEGITAEQLIDYHFERMIFAIEYMQRDVSQPEQES